MSELERAVNRFRAALLHRDAIALAQMRASYDRVAENLQTRLIALTDEIQAARARGDPVSATWLYRQRRWSQLEQQVQAEISRFSEQAERNLRVQQRTSALQGARNAQQLMLLALRGARGRIDVSRVWNSLPARAVEHLVGVLQDGSPLRALLDDLGQTVSASLRETLTVGLATGQNPRQVAVNLQRAFDMGRTRALTVARTEMLRAYRSASLDTYQANSDIVSGWQWFASLSDRTCPMCLAMHGTIHPLSESFATHPNCRCVMLPVVPSSPPVARGESWLEAQPPEIQSRILGAQAADAWRNREVALDDFVEMRYSPRWGASRSTASLSSARLKAEARTRSVAVQTIEWKPTMSREEAERWAAGSAYTGAVYHTTAVENVASLKRGGFDLSRRTFGRVWGDGVYVATDTATAKMYEDWTRFEGRVPQTLELRVQVRKVFVLNVADATDEFTPAEIVAAQMDRGLERLEDRIRAIQANNIALVRQSHHLSRAEREDYLIQNGYVVAPEKAAMVQLLEDEGYDALRVIDYPGLTGRVGGNQIVIFDRKRVVILE